MPTWVLIIIGILIGLGAGVALVLIFGPGDTLVERFGLSKTTPAASRIEKPAPDFELQTLDGQALSLSNSGGKIRVLNFWATWCGPCEQEMPLLQEFQDRYQEQLSVLTVNNGEAEEKVQAFVDRLDLRLPTLLDPGAKVTEIYRVRGFPTTIFIDPQGVIRYQHLGALNRSTLQGYLDDLGVGH